MCQSDHGTMVYTHPYYGLLWFSHKEPFAHYGDGTIVGGASSWHWVQTS